MNAMTEKKPLAIIAEFDGPSSLLEAARQARDRGLTKFDCHSPFPIHGMDEAMGMGRSPLGYIVGVVALLTLATVTYLLYWITAVDYPFIVSGKPYFSYQAYAPIAFALTVLFSAFAAFFGMFHLNRLPQLFHPLFYSEQFAKVSDCGFLMSVESDDPQFAEVATVEFLEEIGGKNVELIREP